MTGWDCGLAVHPSAPIHVQNQVQGAPGNTPYVLLSLGSRSVPSLFCRGFWCASPTVFSIFLPSPPRLNQCLVGDGSSRGGWKLLAAAEFGKSRPEGEQRPLDLVMWRRVVGKHRQYWGDWRDLMNLKPFFEGFFFFFWRVQERQWGHMSTSGAEKEAKVGRLLRRLEAAMPR